jgi:AcrR family transcriptional regulator
VLISGVVSQSAIRRRRSDGERTYHAILAASASLATTEGLHGLSIGRLADHLGMSKSGLYAHFDSKEELQLATIDAAGAVFDREVVAPAAAAPTPRARLEALCDLFLSHVERRVFPGGCFFAAVSSDVDTRAGRVREKVAIFLDGWLAGIARLAREAQAAGELEHEDPEQLAFELDSYLLLANNRFVLTGDPRELDRARIAIRRRLGPA